MATSRKRRLELADRACQQCQKRKTRCVTLQEGEPCAYCSKTDKPCSFGVAPLRTALTRKNLDDAELRCRRLEEIISKIQPGLNIDPILTGQLEMGPLAVLEQAETHQSPRPPPVDREASEENDNDYEWHEAEDLESARAELSQSTAYMPDGMASLDTTRQRSGYLGNTAGSILLESVSSMLSPMPQVPQERSTTRSTQVYVQQVLPTSSMLTNQLSMSAIHTHLIDLYFTSYNVSYPILHEQTFRDQYSKKHLMVAGSIWHIISYMVLAIGEWIGGYCTEEHSLYFDAARSRLRIDFLEVGNVAVVQAFLLLGNYLQKRDRPNTGYNFIGIAYRVALGLGLHREVATNSQANAFQQQRRRLLFWTLYCFESGFSITTGRPTLVSDSFIDVRKPKNIKDSQYSNTSRVMIEVDHPTGSTAIAAQARLAVIANKIHTDFFSVRSCSNVDHQIAILERAIQNWRESLSESFWAADVPTWFLGPRQVVLWKETNLRILLLLAGQRLQTDEDDGAALGVRCQKVATTAISDIAQFCEAHADLIHQGICWYAVYFILQAALALSVYQLKRKQRFVRSQSSIQLDSREEQWESTLERAQSCLRHLGQTNNAAKRTSTILEQLHQRVGQSPAAFPERQQTRSNTAARLVQSAENPTIANSTIQPARSSNTDRPIAYFDRSLSHNNDELRTSTDTSPGDMIATNFVDNGWVGATDPALHMFLDGTQSIDGIFQDLEGFPGTMEQENFAYLTSSMRTIRGDLSNSQWPNFDDSTISDGMGYLF